MSVVHPTLHTQRLRLEPLAERHAAAFVAYCERNRAYFKIWEPDRVPDYYTEAYHRDSIAMTARDSANGIVARFVAFETGSDEIVASFNLSNIRRGVNDSAIVGYSIDEKRAGHGYATELLRAIVAYAFETLGLHRIETSYQPTNRASGRVLYKNGFIVEGYARDYLFLDGAWRDGVLVSLTNAEWKPRPATS